MYRKSYVEINVNNIQNNVKNIIKKYNDYKYYIGVVKGNSYGHGAYLAKYILDAGANYLAISSLDEGIEMRKYVDAPILCLEPIELEYIDKVIENNITITISSIEYYRELIKLNPKNLKVHIKLNTGMNRLGIDEIEEVEEIYNGLINNENIKLEGIYTHFSTTGVQDKIYDYQLEKFRLLTSTIDLNKIEIVHLGRSCNLELHPKIDIANGIRMGLIMYGVGQSFRTYKGLRGKLSKIKHDYLVKKYSISKTYESNDLELKTGLTLKTKIMEIHKLKKGQVVGYGGTYKAMEDSYVAVCPIGYADGISLNFKNSQVSINGKLYSIIGLVNMGMLTIKVDETVKEKDVVTLLGNDVDIKKTSSLIHTTPYVIMTSINQTLPRIYIKDGKVDKIIG